MTKAKPRNLAASVRQRLMNLARARNEDFQLVLTRYALERLLYRLSQSQHRAVFVLKGAMLFQLWGEHPHRPTRDLDLLGTGDNSVPRCEQLFRDICELPVEADGLVFNAASVQGDTIKEDQEYDDLWVLAREFEFEGPLVSRAIQATFARRRTTVPGAVLVALSAEFVKDRAKQMQWRAFVGKGKLDTGGAGLEEVVNALRSFLMPLAEAVASGRLLDMTWPAAGPWRRREPDSTE